MHRRLACDPEFSPEVSSAWEDVMMVGSVPSLLQESGPVLNEGGG